MNYRHGIRYRLGKWLVAQAEKRELVRRVAARMRAENIPIDDPNRERRAKDIAANEMTKFYSEKHNNS